MRRASPPSSQERPQEYRRAGLHRIKKTPKLLSSGTWLSECRPQRAVPKHSGRLKQRWEPSPAPEEVPGLCLLDKEPWAETLRSPNLTHTVFHTMRFLSREVLGRWQAGESRLPGRWQAPVSAGPAQRQMVRLGAEPGLSRGGCRPLHSLQGGSQP